MTEQIFCEECLEMVDVDESEGELVAICSAPMCPHNNDQFSSEGDPVPLDFDDGC